MFKGIKKTIIFDRQQLRRISDHLIEGLEIVAETVVRLLLYPLRRLLVTLLHWPWRKIGITTLLVIFMAWLSLHFYFARPSRLISQLESSTNQLRILEDAVKTTSLTVATLTKSPDGNLENELTQLAKQAQQTNAQVPTKLLFSYAFLKPGNKNAERSQRIRIMYSHNALTAAQTIVDSSTKLTEVSKISKGLLNQKRTIDMQTVEYIAYLEKSVASLEKLDSSEVVNIMTITKIFNFIKEAAYTYRENKDLGVYTYRYGNLSSELDKELLLAWETSVQEPWRILSSQRSHQEAVLALVRPNQ